MSGREAVGLRLGGYALDRLVGRGGMAEVWRAVSLREHHPVAVKVLTARSASEERRVEAFQREVRAVAALAHPRIVPVYDYGVVPLTVSQRSGGVLAAGAPYLVMPLASGGSLSRSRPDDWSALHGDLLQILDALAHAHARGLVHRDLKPGNVLRRSEEGALWLTDFGLVHVADLDVESFDGGTPFYMAPEQFQGDPSAYGPWTDLYALGCMAWRLSTGKPPFPVKHWAAAGQAHAQQPLPTFKAAMQVPKGFEGWLRRLLEKRPESRFVRAADAATVLAGLPGLPGSKSRRRLGGPELSTLFFAEAPTVLTTTSGAVEGQSERRAAVVVSDAADTPPLPLSWRRGVEVPEQWPAGFGLGLVGLRETPMTGRQHERDLLWDALVDVAGSGQPAAVVLSGSAGVGKSRLARWLAERAHEAGAAWLLHASFSDPSGPEDGWRALLRRSLSLRGLSDAAAADRIRDALSALGVFNDRLSSVLIDIATLDDGDGEGVVLLDGARARRAALRTFLTLRAADRVAVVWLDDVHASEDALALMRETLEAGKGRVLFVATLTDEVLVERPIERPEVARLLRHARATEVGLEPLSDSDQAALVEGMLDLDGAFVRELVQRTRGNPALAVQLVSALAQADQLEPSPAGYTVQRGALVPRASGLEEWEARLSTLLGRATAQGHRALQIAALLGHRVDGSEWEDACRYASVRASDLPLDALLRARVVVVDEGGSRSAWRFAHGWVREAVLAPLSRTDRAPRLHKACAAALAKRRGVGVAERRGRHLLAARRPHEAFSALMEGVLERESSHEYASAQLLLQSAEQALSEGGVSRSDARWGELWVARARGALQLAQLEPAVDALAELMMQGDGPQWGPLQAEGALVAGRAELRMGRYEEARERFRVGLEQARRCAPKMVAPALRGVGWSSMYLGDLEQARRCTTEALEVAQERQDHPVIADCLRGLGDLNVRQRRWDEARACYEGALAIPEVRVSLVGRAECVAGLAEVHRLQGRLVEAEEGYREALELQRSVGGETAITRFNLGFVQLARGQFSAARPGLEQVHGSFQARGVSAYAAFAALALAACDAHDRSWDWVDERLAIFEEQVGTKVVDPDLGWLAALVARCCVEGGHGRHAKRAVVLAAGQYRALGDEEAASKVESLLRTG